MFVALFRILLFIAYFCLEFLRRGEKAKSFKAGDNDHYSSILIVAVFIIGIIISPMLAETGIGNLDSEWLIPVGFALAIIGLIVRYSAMTTLGKYYTRTLLTTEDHTIVQSGLYAYVRHPGYTGSILFWIGIALSWHNLLVLILIPLLVFIAYVYRVSSEEKMLVSGFGQSYAEYMSHTKKLVPYIY